MAKELQAPDKIEYAAVDQLLLDAKNPRLGRDRVAKGLSQTEVLELMKDWMLDELGTSFCVSGFWPQEALIAVSEMAGKKIGLVVVEGNRRLAALKMLEMASAGEDVPRVWKEMIEKVPAQRLKDLRERIPYILMPSRASVKSYLGFRHVTGIMEWKPAEKAQFIASLIEDDGLSYEEVRKRIGSRLATVRQNYISYRLLLQMENHAESVDIDKVEERFSVLYLSLRTEGVRTFLQIDIDADPKTAKKPVPQAKLKHLERFAQWLFGDSKHEALFSDSRKVDDFGKILLSGTAVSYLERTEKPSFEVAKRMAGVSESEVASHIETAADEAEESLRAAHTHKTSKRVRDAVNRLALDTIQLARLFPDVLDVMKKELS